MAAIAEEETAHAALSFQISAWARTQLSTAQVRALDEARRTAYVTLRDTLGFRPAAAEALGWPSATSSQAMLDVLAPLLAA